MHVPPKRFVRIRHYGLLSSRNKNRKITLCRNLLGCKKYLSRLKDLDAPAIIRLLYNKDVCKCSSCGGRIIPVGADPSLFRPEPHMLCWYLETEYGSLWSLLKAYFWCSHRGFLVYNSTVIGGSMLNSGQKRSDWNPIYICSPDALCSTRKNRNWCKRKGSYRKAQCCFFVCTIFDSFLNDLSRCLGTQSVIQRDGKRKRCLMKQR